MSREMLTITNWKEIAGQPQGALTASLIEVLREVRGIGEDHVKRETGSQWCKRVFS